MQPWQNYRKNLLTSNVGLTPYFPGDDTNLWRWRAVHPRRGCLLGWFERALVRAVNRYVYVRNDTPARNRAFAQRPRTWSTEE